MKRLNITLRQLRIFEAVSRHLHFHAAAQELCVSQPAVSLQIKQLEDVLGVALFEKIGKRVFLTQDGEIVLKHSNDILADVDALSEYLEVRTTGELSGTLKLSVASASNALAAKWIKNFQKHHPLVDVTITSNIRQLQHQDLHNNKVDLAILGKPRLEEMLEYEKIADYHLEFFAAPDHLLCQQEKVSFEDLKNETLIVGEPQSHTRITVERELAAHHITPKKVIEINYNAGIKEYIKQGFGISLLPKSVLSGELERGTLKSFQVGDKPLYAGLGVAWLPNRNLPRVAQAFIQFLREEVGPLKII